MRVKRTKSLTAELTPCRICGAWPPPATSRLARGEGAVARRRRAARHRRSRSSAKSWRSAPSSSTSSCSPQGRASNGGARPADESAGGSRQAQERRGRAWPWATKGAGCGGGPRHWGDFSRTHASSSTPAFRQTQDTGSAQLGQGFARSARRFAALTRPPRFPVLVLSERWQAWEPWEGGAAGGVGQRLKSWVEAPHHHSVDVT